MSIDLLAHAMARPRAADRAALLQPDAGEQARRGRPGNSDRAEPAGGGGILGPRARQDTRRRARRLIETHTPTELADGPYTLHQLRHSRLTHAAEPGRRHRC